MSDSIRKRILQALVTSFQGIVEGEPESTPYDFSFNLVTRLPVRSLKTGQRAVLGVYAGENPKSVRAGIVMDNMLRVTFEIWMHQNLGENLPDLLEDALTVVERRLMEDQRLGGLCLDINIVSADSDIDGPFDNQAAAQVTADIRYQHHRDNPALEVGQ